MAGRDTGNIVRIQTVFQGGALFGDPLYLMESTMYGKYSTEGCQEANNIVTVAMYIMVTEIPKLLRFLR